MAVGRRTTKPIKRLHAIRFLHRDRSTWRDNGIADRQAAVLFGLAADLRLRTAGAHPHPSSQARRRPIPSLQQKPVAMSPFGKAVADYIALMSASQKPPPLRPAPLAAGLSPIDDDFLLYSASDGSR
jgi:hypothetical protein